MNYHNGIFSKGQFRLSQPFVARAIFYLLFLFEFSFGIQSDFLIITNPEKLSILNQYEQPLTESEKGVLYPYMPFRIINQKEILGDQITEAVRCIHLGSIYFLLKNESGGFISSSPVTFQKISGCTVIEDTVEALSDFSISAKFPSQGVESTIKKGERVIRVFQNGSHTYILRFGKPRQYGWCSTSIHFKKIEISAPTQNTTDVSNISEKIKKRLESANETYKSYFTYFNNMTNQQKSIPYWEFTSDKNSFRCTLLGSATTIEQLQESTHYVIQDIEQLFLGKPFSVTVTGNQILITKR